MTLRASCCGLVCPSALWNYHPLGYACAFSDFSLHKGGHSEGVGARKRRNTFSEVGVPLVATFFLYMTWNNRELERG